MVPGRRHERRYAGLDGAGVRTSAALIYALCSTVFKNITTGANGAGTCVAGYDLVMGRGSQRGQREAPMRRPMNGLDRLDGHGAVVLARLLSVGWH